MKGPGLRLDLDVRRFWRCTSCGTERHTPGSVTLVVCHFCQDHPLMTLVEPERSHRGPVEPPDLLIDLHPDDVDAPAFVPEHLREQDAAVEAPVNAEPADDASTESVEVAPEGPILTEPDAAPDDAATTPTEDSSLKKKSRRKKNRRRKNRRNQSADSPDASESASKDDSIQPPSPGDSFGAGLDA